MEKRRVIRVGCDVYQVFRIVVYIESVCLTEIVERFWVVGCFMIVRRCML